MVSFESMSNRRVTAYRGKNLTIDLQMDRAGIAKVAVGKELRQACTSVVRDRALPYAVSISPYDPKSPGPHYRDQFRITQTTVAIAGLRRVAVRLFNISDHSTAVEWKNGDRVLGRTIGFLLHQSIIDDVLARAAAAERRRINQARFNPAEHPRDRRGRFARKNPPGA